MPKTPKSTIRQDAVTLAVLSDVSQQLTHLLKTADAVTTAILQPALDAIATRLDVLQKTQPPPADCDTAWVTLSAEDAERIPCQFNMHECKAHATHCQHVLHRYGEQSSISFGYACSVHTAKVQATGKWFDTESMI